MFDLVMAQICIKIFDDSFSQTIQINIDNKRIPAALDPRKRYRKQIGQRRLVEPVIAHRRRFERQAKS